MSLVIYDRYVPKRLKVEPIFPIYRGSDRDGSFHDRLLPFKKGRKGRRKETHPQRRPNSGRKQGEVGVVCRKPCIDKAPGHDCDVSRHGPAKLSTDRGHPNVNKRGGGVHAYPGESWVAGGNDFGQTDGERKLPRPILASPTPNDALGETSEHQGDLSAYNSLQYYDEAGDAVGCIPGSPGGVDVWL